MGRKGFLYLAACIGFIFISVLVIKILSVSDSHPSFNPANSTEKNTYWSSQGQYREQHLANINQLSTQLPKIEPKEELVLYNGSIEHIFFHPLIAYPELAFDHDYLSKGYYDWFITVKEFNRILESLYDHNYILIDIDSIYEEKIVDGKEILSKKELLLPKNKKPIILSIDDLNYYDYMRENGNIHKLIVDDKNQIATYSISPDGKEIIAHDNEIIPILESFIKEHKNFSFNGARGIIALTGYQGILGYRTNEMESPDFDQEKATAIQVADRLKEMGWKFASHGYGHLDAKKVSDQRLVNDTLRWKEEVESLIGPTNIYIYPYGSRLKSGSKKLNDLIEMGFKLFMSVGPKPYIHYDSEYILMDRRHIDGIAFEDQKDRLLDLFDVNDVIDEVRNNEK